MLYIRCFSIYKDIRILTLSDGLHRLSENVVAPPIPAQTPSGFFDNGHYNRLIVFASNQRLFLSDEKTEVDVTDIDSKNLRLTNRNPTRQLFVAAKETIAWTYSSEWSTRTGIDRMLSTDPEDADFGEYIMWLLSSPERRDRFINGRPNN